MPYKTDTRTSLPASVQSAIGKQLREAYAVHPHPQLAQDVDDALSRRKHGVLIRQVFNDQSLGKWNEFIKESPDYLAADEIDIIRNERAYLESVGDDLRSHGRPVTMAELGTGEKFAIINKTCETIAAIRPDYFVGIDFIEKSALDAAFRVKERFNEAVGAAHKVADFTKDDLFPQSSLQTRFSVKSYNGPRIFTMYGNTMANTEGLSDELPFAQVDKTVRNIRRHMKTGDYFFLGLQGEQKEDITYHHPRFREFHEQFPEFMKQHLHKDANVKPEDFEFFVKWMPKVSNHIFGYRAKNDGFIKPKTDGATYQYKKGEVIMLTCNSWRFPQTFLDKIRHANDLAPHRIMTNVNKRMFIHSYQAL